MLLERKNEVLFYGLSWLRFHFSFFHLITTIYELVSSYLHSSLQAGLCLGKEQPQVPMALVCGREIEIVGSHGFDGANDMPTILQMVEKKILQPSKLVDRECSLEEGAKVLTAMSHQSPIGVVMITSFE
jgi:threonine dehydrogenase-like Zn-dependent dehydrogenase